METHSLTHTPMNRNTITIALLMFGLAASARADLAASLEAFAAYELGQPRKVLHEARLAAMAGTDQAGVRAAHEQQLLGFVQSGASLAARREACLWLGSIGSAKSLPVLEKLSRDEALADVAAIAARDIGGEKPVAAEAAGHALAKFRAEVAGAAKPAAVLIGAIEGGSDDVARLAFGLVAQGTAAAEVAAWLGTSIQKLSPERQVLALNMVPGIDAAVIGRLAREGAPELRATAVAMLGGEKGGPRCSPNCLLAATPDSRRRRRPRWSGWMPGSCGPCWRTDLPQPTPQPGRR